MLEETPILDKRLDAYWEKYSDLNESEDPIGEFGEIIDNMFELEASPGWAADTAILMAVIDLESTVNRFCYFNLGEHTANAIENLPMTGKLEVVHRALGSARFKGTKPYAAVRALIVWRNAFAHGKNTDMPVRTLKENHLSMPDKHSSPEDVVKELVTIIRGYIAVERYLTSLGQHPYTRWHSTDTDDIEDGLKKIEAYYFADGRVRDKSKQKRPVRSDPR